MQHGLTRHQESPAGPCRLAFFIEGMSTLGAAPGVYVRRRQDMIELLRLQGWTGPFYLSSFVKKFTYSGVDQFRLPADNLKNILTRKASGAERNEYSEPAGDGDEPLMAVLGGEYKRQNVDGGGLVFRRRHAGAAAMSVRFEPNRSDPQLPIEEELYG